MMIMMMMMMMMMMMTMMIVTMIMMMMMMMTMMMMMMMMIVTTITLLARHLSLQPNGGSPHLQRYMTPTISEVDPGTLLVKTGKDSFSINHWLNRS